MMLSTTYQQRRGQIETYFDRTAMAAWARLTSDAPVSGVRATVRAGRDSMRGTLLSWMPQDMTGMRVLDAGCGTGALALVAASRGAEVVAIDLSPQLVTLAAERAGRDPFARRVTFCAGDMLNPELGEFDYVVLMDSIIHYAPSDAIAALAALAARTRRGILFTFAPHTTLRAGLLAAGQLFPRGDRSPSIVLQREGRLRRSLADHDALSGWRQGRSRKVSSGFYISQAMELVR